MSTELHARKRAQSSGISMRNTVLALVTMSAVGAVASCTGLRVTTLDSGSNVQAAIDAAPARTVFVLKAGVYRLRSVKPKDHQRFVGEKGTVISGAMLVGGWRRLDEDWVADGIPEPLRPSGYCAKDGDKSCLHREDLFVDGARYRRVFSREAIGPGLWYRENGRIHLRDDPSDRLIELSVAPTAFTGNAKGVVLENLIIEKFATGAQDGAIDGRESRDWQLRNLTVRWNHGGGLRLGKGMHVSGGAYVRNGQIGMVGEGDDAIIESLQIAFNNYAGFSSGWEAGGTKFWNSDNLIIRNTCVHNNDGPGLWTDINNTNVLIEGNKVFDNAGDGIKHEISYSAIIRDNVAARNGKPTDNWLWGSQILIQNSSDTEVYGNVVEVGPKFGNAIGLINQKRGSGSQGPWITQNNYVHDNTMIFLGRQGMAGLVADFERERFRADASNRFEKNRYIVPSPDQRFWLLFGAALDWRALQAQKQFEKGGSVVQETRSPAKLSCGG